MEHGPSVCDAPTVQEADLHEAVIRAVILKEDVSPADGINVRLEELQKELQKLANARKDYGGIAGEIDQLRELKQKALAERAEREGLKKQVAEMRKFLREQDTKVTEYDEQLVRRLIEKVTVFDDKITVRFKSGVEIDVKK